MINEGVPPRESNPLLMSRALAKLPVYPPGVQSAVDYAQRS